MRPNTDFNLTFLMTLNMILLKVTRGLPCDGRKASLHDPFNPASIGSHVQQISMEQAQSVQKFSDSAHLHGAGIRVGEPDGAVGADAHVIGAVEGLPLPVVQQRRRLTADHIQRHQRAAGLAAALPLPTAIIALSSGCHAR